MLRTAQHLRPPFCVTSFAEVQRNEMAKGKVEAVEGEETSVLLDENVIGAETRLLRPVNPELPEPPSPLPSPFLASLTFQCRWPVSHQEDRSLVTIFPEFD